MGKDDAGISERFDRYGQTLHSMDPEASTLRVARQEGQNGQVIVIFRESGGNDVEWSRAMSYSLLFFSNGPKF